MKDKEGHGSNGRGSAVGYRNTGDVNRFGATARFQTLKPTVSNADAASTLATAKSTQAPINSGMSGSDRSAPLGGGSAKVDANGVSTEGDYGKNLANAYRAKHGWSGDVGSGAK